MHEVCQDACGMSRDEHGRVITLITSSHGLIQGHVQSRLEYHDTRRNGQKSEILRAFGNINGASFRMSSHQ